MSSPCVCVLQSCSGSVFLEVARFKASSYGDQVNALHKTTRLVLLCSTFELCDIKQYNLSKYFY